MDLKELLELAGHMKMSDKETGFNPLACFIPYVTCKEIVHTQILESIFNLDKSLGAISFINHFLPDINHDGPKRLYLNKMRETLYDASLL